MKREWKPGDVALVKNEYDVWNVAIRVVDVHNDKWQYGVSQTTASRGAQVRPLLVIDPEDREAVGRLADKLAIGSGMWLDRTQAALRSMLAPPKPPEPQGLGAVVEDGNDNRWTRIYGGSGKGEAWYCDDPTHDEQWKRYDALTPAVRVLSEGVTP